MTEIGSDGRHWRGGLYLEDLAVGEGLAGGGEGTAGGEEPSVTGDEDALDA